VCTTYTQTQEQLFIPSYRIRPEELLNDAEHDQLAIAKFLVFNFVD